MQKTNNNTVIYNGTNQIVAHSGSIGTYWDLEFSGGGTKTINYDIDVRGILTMTSGDVSVNPARTFGIGINAANPGTLNYTSGIVIGELRRWITSTAVDYIFPVGIASQLNTFTFRANSGLTNGSLVAEFINSDPGETGFPIADGASSVFYQFTEGYWHTSALNSFVCTDYNITALANGFSTFAIDANTRLINRDNAPSNWKTPNPGTHGINSGNSINRTNYITSIVPNPGTTDFGIGHPTVCPGSNNI